MVRPKPKFKEGDIVYNIFDQKQELQIIGNLKTFQSNYNRWSYSTEEYPDPWLWDTHWDLAHKQINFKTVKEYLELSDEN